MTDSRPVHSHIGASSMSRWKNCPGSVELSREITNVSGVAAQEGTAAHEIVGLALMRAFSDNKPTREVLNDIIEALYVYTDYVESLKEKYPCHIEHSFDMDDIFPDLYGTADCVIYNKTDKILHVIDYKHGKGLPIDVENNLQLQYYALGALHTLPYHCAEVQMTIVQPRCYHPGGMIRSWRVSALHFIDFKLELIAAAKETQKKKAKLLAGDHCMFCLAKKTCPQKQKQSAETAKKELTFYRDPALDFKPKETNYANDANDPLNNLYDWGF